MEVNWEEIKLEYVSTDTSYRELCDKYGVTMSQVSKRATRGDWVALRNMRRKATEKKVVEYQAEKQAERYKRFMNLSDRLLDILEEKVSQIEAGAANLDESTVKTLASAMKDIKGVQGLRDPAEAEEQRVRLAIMNKQLSADAPQEIKVTIGGGIPEWSE